MPKVSPIYTSWASGELSPLLKGRSDVQQYSQGANDLYNCLSLPYGPYMNRPGSFYSAEVKDSSKETRLLEFVFSTTDSAIIEFGEDYFRFFTNSGQVFDGTVPYEVAHTYTEDELFDVHIAQSKDVIYIAHGSHPPAKLQRFGATNWVLSDIDFIGGPLIDTNITATTITPSADTGSGITLTASTAIFTADHVGSVWRVKDGTVKITAFTDTTHVDGDVQALSDGTAGDLGTGPAATDDWAEGAWSDERGWPARVTFHEQRLFWARTDYQPQNLWGSKPFIYEDYTPGEADGDGIAATLATEQSNDIKWLTSGQGLAAGTFGGEFIISAGVSGESLTPANLNTARQTGWGSESIQPRKIGNYVYYVQRPGRKVRELYYYWDLDSYKSVDVTVLSEHITESGIKQMTFQQNPYNILYAVLNNGKIACMTREIDQQVLAWTPQETPGADGLYESVASIPQADDVYDQVWYVANRTIDGSTVRYIEYFDSPIIGDRQDLYNYLDSALRYNAFTETEDASVTLSLDAQTGSITATASGSYFTSGDVGQRIRAIDTDGNRVGELEITGYTSPTVVTGTSKADFDATSYAAGSWGVSVNDISGLDHLEGETVQVYVDGATDEEETVSTGAISIETDGFVILVGLQYTAYWRPMPPEAGSATGTAQGKKKRVYQLGLKVYKTLGIKIGGDLTHLDLVYFRDPQTLLGDPEPVFTGSTNARLPNTTADFEGQFYVYQDNPYPMCILSAMPLMDTWDR